MKLTVNNLKLYIDNMTLDDEEEVFEDPRCKELFDIRKKYLKAIESILDSIDYNLSYTIGSDNQDSFEELLSFDEEVAEINEALTNFCELAAKALYPEG